MNNLDVIKEKQDVVYTILNNSLEQNKLSHAYLFSGIQGSLQIETAYTLLQTMVCQEGLWGCGVCDNCLRIQENTYPDFITIDGRDHLIKKEEVIDLQKQFSLTAFEASSAKLFLIQDAHNMTASAANSLLKFLEEPSDNVLGILVSDQVETMLPTIISRCTTLNFKTLSSEDRFMRLKELGYDARDAYYYSRVVKDYIGEEQFLEDKAYLLFKSVFEKVVASLYKNSNRSLLIIQNELLKHSNKAEADLALGMFLDMLIVFLNDSMGKQKIDGWYDEMIDEYKTLAKAHDLLSISLETKNKVSTYINNALLMDQMIYKFQEVL